MNALTSLSNMSLTDISSARSLAISAGDLSVVVRQEVQRILEGNQNDLTKSIDWGFEDLARRNLISGEEAQSLKDLCKHLLNSIRRREDAEDAFFAIKKAYAAMILDPNSSPVALAIASAASSAFEFEKTNSVSITPSNTGAGAVVGGIIGGAIGGIVGGGLGAAIGAGIGAAAGAAIGYCNKHGV